MRDRVTESTFSPLRVLVFDHVDDTAYVQSAHREDTNYDTTPNAAD